MELLQLHLHRVFHSARLAATREALSVLAAQDPHSASQPLRPLNHQPSGSLPPSPNHQLSVNLLPNSRHCSSDKQRHSLLRSDLGNQLPLAPHLLPTALHHQQQQPPPLPLVSLRPNLQQLLRHSVSVRQLVRPLDRLVVDHRCLAPQAQHLASPAQQLLHQLQPSRSANLLPQQ